MAPAVPSGKGEFSYKRRKEPKAAAAAAAAPADAQPVVVHAVAAQVFKYVGDEYVPQGKLGCAILSKAATREYSIMLYQSNKQPVMSMPVTTAFVMTPQKSGVAYFYDVQRQVMPPAM